MVEESHSSSVQGQILIAPYLITEDIRTTQGVLVQQQAFPLTEADWAYLRYGHRWLITAAHTLLFIGIGSVIHIIAKVVDRFLHPKAQASPLESWEWWVPGLTILIAIMCYFIGWLLPSEGTRVRRTINYFFKEARRPK